MSWWSNLGPQTYKVVAHVVNLDVTPEVNQDAPAKESVPTTAGAPAKQSVPTGAATAAGVETAPSERVSAHGSVGSAVKSYVIRLACVNDCSAIAKLELASAQFERRLTPINYTFDELRTLWRKRINSGEFYVLVAEGQVAGGDKAALVGQSGGGADAFALTNVGFCWFESTAGPRWLYSGNLHRSVLLPPGTGRSLAEGGRKDFAPARLRPSHTLCRAL